MALAQEVLGAGVAKDGSEVCHLSSAPRARRPAPRAALARSARPARGALGGLAASGGYARSVTDALAEAGAAFARVTPARPATLPAPPGGSPGPRAGGPRPTASTPRSWPAWGGRSVSTPRRPRTRSGRAWPSSWPGARTGWAPSPANAAGEVGLAILGPPARSAGACACWRRIKAVEGQIRDRIQAEDALRHAHQRLGSRPGMGPAHSATLRARLPELGGLDRRRIASRAGLAPQSCDPGLPRGQRHIRGGRAEGRRGLYLAAFMGSRYDPGLRTFREPRLAAGKPLKVALAACGRKIPTLRNAMFREGVDYRRTPA
jgi:transposase